MLLVAASAQAAPTGYGRLSGVVVDPNGTPQMGASVSVQREDVSGLPAMRLLTNQRGLFTTDRLAAGLYAVHVTLAGFLPAIERHVHISSNLTTLLKIELDSVFTSLDRLRRRPEQPMDPEEWKWVLRATSSTRPVLQWMDGGVVGGEPLGRSESGKARRPHGRIELTGGSRHPGSVANAANTPGTAFSYDQRVGRAGRLLLAGRMSYERAGSLGVATIWLPLGDAGGPAARLVVRQAQLGPTGPTFRALRLKHSDQLPLGDRLVLHYGADYVLVGLRTNHSTLRPHGKLDIRLSPNWRASMLFAADPASQEEAHSPVLQSALAELEAMPTVLWHDGRPALENRWHEEVGIERQLGGHATIQGAAFRDHVRHLAVFGRGASPSPDFFQDPFAYGLAYDGGASNSWGTRVAFRQKFSDELELTAVYSWAGALTLEDLLANVDRLRDGLQTKYAQSLAARVAGRLPKTRTHVSAGYKWTDAAVVTRQDVYGETSYKLEPFLNVSVRQPLPSFLSHWEAQMDFRNLLAQGYVTVMGRDRHVVLVPAWRTFRGGISFQF